MRNNINNAFKNPSKKNLIIFTFIWFFGILLLTLSLTDLFAESFFKNANLVIYFLIIYSTSSLILLYKRYRNNRKQSL